MSRVSPRRSCPRWREHATRGRKGASASTDRPSPARTRDITPRRADTRTPRRRPHGNGGGVQSPRATAMQCPGASMPKAGPVFRAPGAEVRGVDPAGDLPDSAAVDIRATLLEHKMVFLRDQGPTTGRPGRRGRGHRPCLHPMAARGLRRRPAPPGRFPGEDRTGLRLSMSLHHHTGIPDGSAEDRTREDTSLGAPHRKG